MWYPDAPSRAGARPVTAVAQGTTDGINTAVAGKPAVVSGSVDAGDTQHPPTTVVTARPTLGPRTGETLGRARTRADGSYTIGGLPAPATYELTFSTPGYEASTLIDTVSGGDKRFEPTVQLGAGNGQISGTVTSNGQPIGGVTVSTTVDGHTVSVGTPTTGQVGTYVLGHLATPATYVVTASSPGRGSSTQILDLAAGQSRAGLDFALGGQGGLVTGKVVGPGGAGLGGATVTIGGAAGGSGSVTTTTLTAGDTGSFTVGGLRNGNYTLSVTKQGYQSASRPITISSGAAPSQRITLKSLAGAIRGMITSGGSPYAGATVTAANGTDSVSTTSNSSTGGYRLTGLSPGSYSLTVSAPGLHQRTALVTVQTGRTTEQNVQVQG